MKTHGRASAIGRCTPVLLSEVKSPTAKGDVEWTRLDIQSLRLSQASALLVLQGQPLMKLFEGVLFLSPGFDLRGTFVLLRGQLSEFHAPPLLLNNIVLGSIQKFPQDLSKEELMSTLLGNVLPPPSPAQ